MKKTGSVRRSVLSLYAGGIATLGVGLLGCGEGTDTIVESPVAFTCEPGRDPGESVIHRLTRVQYERTLTDLLGRYYSEAEVADILDAVSTRLAAVPGESSEDIGRVDHTLAQEHVDNFYQVGWGVGQLLTTGARLETLLGSCASDSDSGNDTQCVSDFLDEFGPLVLRRPMRTGEHDFYLGLYGDHDTLHRDALADMLTVLLTAPHFVYHIEDEGEPVDNRDDLIQVSPYHLAARLSYHFWQTMPDEALMAAAADGRLQTDEGYEAEVERIFNHPRTRETLNTFVHQWLHLEELPPLHPLVGTPKFDAFAGTDSPTPQLQHDMMEEVRDFVSYHIWDHDGQFADLFTGEQAFAKTEELAQLYEIPVWVEGGPPNAFPAGQRPGLLSRAAFLATGTTTTQPIEKGVFIRRKLLCDSLGEPPDDLSGAPEPNPLTSRRTQTETLTESDGSNCVICHERINHLGYPTEAYDALGRYRAIETIYDDNGSILAEPVVNTTSTPQVVLGDLTPASNLADLNQLILDSGKAEACMARHYFRFAYARIEDLDLDGCALEQIRSDLTRGLPLKDALKQVVLQPEFKLRKRGAQ